MAKKRKSPPKKQAGDGAAKPRCGLCGKTKNLIQTACCGNWICDDEHNYVLFSYRRSSCSRNHDRYTLCGAHFAEGYAGRWQDCAQCRKAYETEMYVWYGTNEYNFEKLENPPEFEPTLCKRCQRRINLGTDGYAYKSGDYYCAKCSANDFAGLSG